MGQTLDNGIYLPSEGERNCYEGLAGNWVALDNHLGSTNIHVTINDKQAWDGHVADSVKHVTAEDKAAWNGKADASALTAHTGDTTIHVTAADKQTWNGKQDALSQTQLDAVNSGIDSTKVQQIATNTSDISSLQSGKANDSNVVHKSGNETISGAKTFLDVPISFKSSTAELGVTGGNTKVIFTDKNLLNLAGITFGNYGSSKLSYCRFHIYDKDSNNQEVENYIEFSYVNNNQTAYVRPNKSNFVTLGSPTFKWKQVYATNYYYGNGNVEFSTKFVTSDTAQTITGNKTFSSDVNVYNSDSSTDTANIVLKNSKAEVGTEFSEQSINFVDKNNNPLAKINCYGSSGNFTRLYITAYDANNNSEGFYIRKSSTGTSILPTTAASVRIGNDTFPYLNVQTKRVNNLEPSSLSLPSGNVSDVIDISSYITALDGTSNSYTVPANGWISIAVVGTAIAILSSKWSDSRLKESSGNVRMLYPVLKNETVGISVTGTTLAYARFIPCQGNV